MSYNGTSALAIVNSRLNAVGYDIVTLVFVDVLDVLRQVSQVLFLVSGEVHEVSQQERLHPCKCHSATGVIAQRPRMTSYTTGGAQTPVLTNVSIFTDCFEYVPLPPPSPSP